MAFTVNIATSNAAFTEEGDPGIEIARILRDLADTAESSGFDWSVPLRDINGNSVGTASLDRF